MADRERGERVGSLRVPRIWYRSRVTVAMVLAAGLLSGAWHVHSTRVHWDDVFTGLVDLRPVLLCAWFWLSSLLCVLHRWTVGAVRQYGVCRVLTLLMFFGMAATALGVFFLGSLNEFAWNFIKDTVIQKLDRNILRITDGREFFDRVEHHPQTKGKRTPCRLETFERFNGEDVMLNCRYNFEVREDVNLHSGMIHVIWLHKNEIIHNSSRHFIDKKLEKLHKSREDEESNTYFMYTFTSKLQIYFLEEADYGDYSCLVHKESLHGNAPKKRQIQHKCRPCRFEAVDPRKEFWAAFKCYQRYMDEILSFQNRLLSVIRENVFLSDRLTYESYVNESDYLYYCTIKQLKTFKKKCLETNRDVLGKHVDDLLKQMKASRKSSMDTLLKLRPTVLMRSDNQGTVIADEFHLVQVTERLEQMTAAPGSMFFFASVFHHLEDSDPVTVTYEINGRPVDFCEESVGACSMIVLLYWFFFKDGVSGHVKDFLFFPSGCKYLFKRQWNYNARLYVEFWKCLCYSSFGTHRFIFHREFYNASAGRITVHSFPHPHGVYIAPRRSELFSFFSNTSGDTDDSPIETCWGTHTPGPPEYPCNLQEPLLMDSISWFWWKEMAVMILVSIVWIWVLELGLVGFPLLLGGHGRRLILEGEIFPMVLPPGLPALGGLAPTPNLDSVHDVFISYAEEQSSLAETSLANILETSGLEVFLRKRDIALGSREHAQRVGAIDLSQRFLIVVSPDYVEDPLLNYHEFQYILALVHDGLRHQHDVLLYLAGDCHVPHVLHAYPRLDATRLSDLDLRTRLLAWAGRAPVTFPGWRSWVPVLPVWSCAAVCLLALALCWEFFRDTSSL